MFGFGMTPFHRRRYQVPTRSRPRLLIGCLGLTNLAKPQPSSSRALWIVCRAVRTAHAARPSLRAVWLPGASPHTYLFLYSAAIPQVRRRLDFPSRSEEHTSELQ